MYKSLVILKDFEYSNYYIISSSMYHDKNEATKFMSNEKYIIFKIVTNYYHIKEMASILYNNNFGDKDKLIYQLWYINYYINYNSIDYDIITNKQNYFNFIGIENV